MLLRRRSRRIPPPPASGGYCQWQWHWNVLLLVVTTTTTTTTTMMLEPADLWRLPILVQSWSLLLSFRFAVAGVLVLVGVAVIVESQWLGVVRRAEPLPTRVRVSEGVVGAPWIETIGFVSRAGQSRTCNTFPANPAALVAAVANDNDDDDDDDDPKEHVDK